MRLGFKTAPQRVDWPSLEAIWGLAGEMDVFDSAWTFDHLYPVDGDGPCFEGWTTLALLAHHVPHKQIGHLVLANPYRHPALLAKMATAMDHGTQGRFVLGLGAGGTNRKRAPTASVSTPSRSACASLSRRCR